MAGRSTGRKGTPTALRLLRGNTEHRPMPTNEPDVPTIIPDMPPGLLEKEGQAEWKRLTTLLESVGLVTLLDRALLAAYCRAWERYLAAERHISLGDDLILPPSYAVDTWARASKEEFLKMNAIASKFGLSPSDRVRLSVNADAGGEGTPWEKLTRKA